MRLAPRAAPSYALRLTRAAVFAGAAACGSAPPPQQTRPPPVEYPFTMPPAPAPGRARLSGVVREDGYRSVGVRVQVRNVDEQTSVETFTNNRGEFQLELGPGMYEVVADPGYQNPRPQDGPVLQQGIQVELQADANERRDLNVIGPMPYTPDTGPCCKPYGAPPARRRIV